METSSRPLPPLAEWLLAFEPAPKRLGELLIEDGACDQSAIDRALAAQVGTKRLLGEVLIEQQACSAKQLESALTRQRTLSSPWWDLLGKIRPADGLQRSQYGPERNHAVVLSAGEKYLQLSPEEGGLFEIVTRESNYGSILKAYWDHCGRLVSPDQLLSFLQRLRDAELLASDEGLPGTTPRRRLWVEWFQWRLPLYNPDKTLGWTAQMGRLVFSWPMAALGLVGVLVAAFVLFRSWDVFGPLAVARVTHHGAGHLGILIMATFTVFVVHEWGHAAACHLRGGRVPRAGVMLYFLIPMAYCDVSSAHLFPRKRDRALVSLGGIWTQTLLGVAAALLWAASPDGLLRQYVAWVAVVSLLSSLLNFNPLIRLDGYYLLTDLLEFPNLRTRAFEFVLSWLRGRPVRPRNRREGVLLAVYGVLGIGFSLALLGYMLLLTGHHLHGLVDWAAQRLFDRHLH